MDAATLIADLKNAFPRSKVDIDTLRIYMRELQDLPNEALELAVRDLIRSEEFFPSIRAIRERTSERLLCLPSDEDALSQVERRIRWTREMRDDDDVSDAPKVHPVVKEALDHVGGFHAFRTTDKPEVVRGQFLKMYGQLRTNRVRAIQVDGGRALPAA